MHFIYHLPQRMWLLWNRYWFREGGRKAAGVIRIGVSLCVLSAIYMVAKPDHAAYLGVFNPGVYDPISVLRLLGSKVPSPAFFTIAKYVAIAATVMSLIGFLTRFSMALSLFSTLVLVAIIYSWGNEWNHGLNIIFLAQIPLIFIRSGDFLSLDRLIFKKHQQAPLNGYHWGINLALLAITLMFLNAAYFKVVKNPGLSWVFSDNLRNYIIQQFLVVFKTPIPDRLLWVVNNEWAYKGLAMGNLLLQGTIILVCVFVYNPWIRLLFGLFFFLEVFGLGFAMDLWEWHWIPLVVFFVDWDRFLPWLRQRLSGTGIFENSGKNMVHGNENRMGLWQRVLATVFILSFTGYYIAVAFDSKLTFEKEHKSYPFTAFPMYSSLYCKKPYDRHLTVEYRNAGLEIIAMADTGRLRLAEATESQPLYRYNTVEFVSMNQVTNALGEVAQRLGPVYGIEDWEQIRWYRVLEQCPAYPDMPALHLIHRGLIAKYNADGSVQAVIAVPRYDEKGNEHYLDFLVEGYEDYEIEVQVIKNHREGPLALKGQWSETRFVYEPPAREEVRHLYLFVITITDGTGQRDTYFSGLAWH